MEMVDQAMEDFDTAVKLKPDFAIARVQKTYTDYRHACATEGGSRGGCGDLGVAQRWGPCRDGRLCVCGGGYHRGIPESWVGA